MIIIIRREGLWKIHNCYKKKNLRTPPTPFCSHTCPLLTRTMALKELDRLSGYPHCKNVSPGHREHQRPSIKCPLWCWEFKLLNFFFFFFSSYTEWNKKCNPNSGSGRFLRQDVELAVISWVQRRAGIACSHLKWCFHLMQGLTGGRPGRGGKKSYLANVFHMDRYRFISRHESNHYFLSGLKVVRCEYITTFKPKLILVQVLIIFCEKLHMINVL